MARRRKADHQNGRGLTYRERWEQMRGFCANAFNSDFRAYSTESNVSLKAFTGDNLLREMRRLDATRVVKARPTSKADQAKLTRIVRRQQRRRKGKR
jgi:hypothetical protein